MNLLNYTYYDLATDAIRSCTKPLKMKGNPMYYVAKDAVTKRPLVLSWEEIRYEGGFND